MPPSFMVNKYKLVFNTVDYQDIKSKGHIVKGYVTKGELLLDINESLHKYVIDKWREQSPKRANDYIYWPPRCAIVERSVVENDVLLKLEKWRIYREEINKLYFPGCLDIAYDWVCNAKSSLTNDENVVRSYVLDHQESHPVKGYTWNQLLKAKLMPRLYDFTSTVIDKWESDFYLEGNWCIDSSSFNIGMRARSPDNIIFNYSVPFELERGRQIGYNPGPSSVNAFISHIDMIKIMSKIFRYYEHQLGFKIYCPKIDGGKVYTLIRDAYLEGKDIRHYDVAGMELITPSIINGDTRNFPFGLGMVIGRRGDMPELLSGVGPTSDWDMIAHLELIKKVMIKKPEFIVILGDDATWIGGEVIQTPLYERQDADDRTVRTLGLTCSEYMHPIGRNITIDTADKRINVELDGQTVVNKMDFEERRKIADYFTGWIGGVPSHEIIGKVSPEAGKYSPRELIESQIGIAATT
jgi:hypothetical protein